MINRIRKWWQYILIQLRVRSIAFLAMRESWEKVRLRTAGLPMPRAFEYVERHSAAIVHKRVELLLRRNPAIDGCEANLLIVKASERLNHQLLRRLSRGSRAKLRVA
jgi:hypothetical protein